MRDLALVLFMCFFSSIRRHTRSKRDWSSDVCSSDLSRVRRLPAGRRACIYHVGYYLSVGRSYEALLAWCREQKLQVCSDSYEFCINDYLTTHDESEYITKIAFYVKEQA